MVQILISVGARWVERCCNINVMMANMFNFEARIITVLNRMPPHERSNKLVR